MDSIVFSKWFDIVFAPHVCRRIGRKDLLIFDNVLGHDTAFETNRIQVVFFPPNVTSWKQPMDMGIITAMKKRYKFLMMKAIIAYHNVRKENKAQLSLVVVKMKGGTTEV